MKKGARMKETLAECIEEHVEGIKRLYAIRMSGVYRNEPLSDELALNITMKLTQALIITTQLIMIQNVKL